MLEQKAVEFDTTHPAWFTFALAKLQESYPKDQFQGFMAQCGTDIKTKLEVYVPEGQSVPAGTSIHYEPRILCLDCRGRGKWGRQRGAFDCGPNNDMRGFRSHLKSRDHRYNVQERLAPGTAKEWAPAESSDDQISMNPSSDDDASDQPPAKKVCISRGVGLRGTD